jgi:hypothetical protein
MKLAELWEGKTDVNVRFEDQWDEWQRILGNATVATATAEDPAPAEPAPDVVIEPASEDNPPGEPGIFAEPNEPNGAKANKPHVAYNSGQNEWYTPPEYLAAARQVLGTIDLDPASSDVAQQNVRADRYFTKEDDGLSQPWSGKVWLNPPYATGLIEKFVNKLCDHFDNGDVTEAIALTNNGTETRWFQSLAERASATCLPSRRVKFLDTDGDPGDPLQGQAVVYLGKNVTGFTEAFQDFGSVVHRP